MTDKYAILYLLLITRIISNICALDPTDKQVVVTLHSYRKNWNEAQHLCMLHGGNLYREDSEEKAIVLEKYRSSVDWKQESSTTQVWIGLHSVRINGSYFWTYGMDTCQAVNDTIHSNWEVGKSVTDKDKRCALQNRISLLKWESTGCKAKTRFVCETNTDTPCNYTKTTGSPSPNIADFYRSSSFTDVSGKGCRDKCLLSTMEKLNCWAANYNTFSKKCTLYYSVDPFLFSDVNAIENNTLGLYLKSCYVDQINHKILYIRITPSTNPYKGCASLTSAPLPGSSANSTSTKPVPTTATNSLTVDTVHSTILDMLQIGTQFSLSSPTEMTITDATRKGNQLDSTKRNAANSSANSTSTKPVPTTATNSLTVDTVHSTITDMLQIGTQFSLSSLTETTITDATRKGNQLDSTKRNAANGIMTTVMHQSHSRSAAAPGFSNVSYIARRKHVCFVFILIQYIFLP